MGNIAAKTYVNKLSISAFEIAGTKGVDLVKALASRLEYSWMQAAASMKAEALAALIPALIKDAPTHSIIVKFSLTSPRSEVETCDIVSHLTAQIIPLAQANLNPIHLVPIPPSSVEPVKEPTDDSGFGSDNANRSGAPVCDSYHPGCPCGRCTAEDDRRKAGKEAGVQKQTEGTNCTATLGGDLANITSWRRKLTSKPGGKHSRPKPTATPFIPTEPDIPF